MAFPSTLDSFVAKTDNTDDVLASHMNVVQTAVEALEAKVGVNNSAVITSLDYLLKNASSQDPGHVHTLSDGAVDVTVSYTRINDFLDSAITTAYSTMDAFYTNFYTSGRKLYFYENTAPTGWTIVAVTDAVLAVKGGAQAYNTTGGTTAGTWTQPNHTLITNEIPAHTHTYNTGSFHTAADFSRVAHGNENAPSTLTSSSTGGGAAHNHGTTYRPYGAIGIIASKD